MGGRPESGHQEESPLLVKLMSKNIKPHQTSPNKLCTSCRRTCKQVASAVVASCPRYYPFKRIQGKSTQEFNWKQMELSL